MKLRTLKHRRPLRAKRITIFQFLHNATGMRADATPPWSEHFHLTQEEYAAFKASASRALVKEKS